MGKRRKSLFDNIKERLALLLMADDDFILSVRKTETAIWSSILSLLRGFTIQDGKIQSDESSTKTAAKIKRETKKVLVQSTLRKKVDEFIKKFDRVEEFTKKIYAEIVGTSFSMPKVKSGKDLAIETLVKSLKEIEGLETNYLLPLQRLLFQVVETNMEFTDAVNVLRDYVRGEENKGGQLSKYARQVATDLLNGYSGYVDQKIADKNGLDGFYYSGSLIKTSRQTCIDLVNGTGEFEDLNIKDSLYSRESIPEIVRRSKNNKGWRPETTAANFAINRGGYNCRHNLIFVPLTPSERDRVEEIGRQLKGLKDFEG